MSPQLVRAHVRLACGVSLALTSASAGAAGPPAGPVFVDRSVEAGMDFVHWNGMSGELYYSEMMGPGAALFDYDGDGDLDAYLAQGANLGPGKTPAEARPPWRGTGPPRGRLFRNDLSSPGASPRFVDVTEASGLDARGYGMGVTACDVDGDGRLDLYLANFGPDQLWRNRGDGTFEDVSARSGVGDPAWGITATCGDFDRDGDLDLFVVRYVAYDLAANPRCFADSTRRDYCGPSTFGPLPDLVLRNRGDGTFEDVSAFSGVGRLAGPGLGAVTADLDGDGWLDVYVANDGSANFLWLNRRDGTFREEALFAGAALNRDGMAEAGMGVDAGDADGDGILDLFLAHLTGETNTLYLQRRPGLFEDRTVEAGLAAASLPFTSFGTRFLDIDLDGRLDLAVVNGAVRILDELARRGDPHPLGQTDQLFWNAGGGRFVDVSDRAGDAFALLEAGRGLAVGDVDEDGDPDLLVTNNSGAARFLVNQAGNGRPWLGVALLDRRGREPLGVVVEMLRHGAPALLRRYHRDGSYQSSSDPRAVFGLGDGPTPEALRIRWPDGSTERFAVPAAGRYTTLRQGGGKEEAP